jgi:hypothetical protein
MKKKMSRQSKAGHFTEPSDDKDVGNKKTSQLFIHHIHLILITKPGG